MQISSGFARLPLSLPVDRDPQGTRQQQDTARERLNSDTPNEALKGTSNNASTTRVEPSQRSSESRFQRVRGFEELPLQNRTAVNAYLAAEQEDVASPAQLAGIDVYV